ncbi:hypothetical protein [Escherichia phage FL20]
MKTNESVIPPPFGRIPIVITKSNMSFVEVGEHTHITTMHGNSIFGHLSVNRMSF